MTERRADDATRDAVKWLKAEYMLDRMLAVDGNGLVIDGDHVDRKSVV